MSRNGAAFSSETKGHGVIREESGADNTVSSSIGESYEQRGIVSPVSGREQAEDTTANGSGGDSFDQPK